jgi:hypothetical protein
MPSAKRTSSRKGWRDSGIIYGGHCDLYKLSRTSGKVVSCKRAVTARGSVTSDMGVKFQSLSRFKVLKPSPGFGIDAKLQINETSSLNVKVGKKVFCFIRRAPGYCE